MKRRRCCFCVSEKSHGKPNTISHSPQTTRAFWGRTCPSNATLKLRQPECPRDGCLRRAFCASYIVSSVFRTRNMYNKSGSRRTFLQDMRCLKFMDSSKYRPLDIVPDRFSGEGREQQARPQAAAGTLKPICTQYCLTGEGTC